MGDPLYLDVVARWRRRGRGLSRFAAERGWWPEGTGFVEGVRSRVARAVFDELGRERPRPHFTVGIKTM